MSWIKDYEGLYKIYPNGDIESYQGKNPIIKKTFMSNIGYVRITLNKNGVQKKFSIHRLVAIHFIDNPNGYCDVDHIDRDKQNNNLQNLRWVTQSINNRNRKNYGEYLKGVTKTANGKRFVAHIRINGKKKHLGVFDTEIEAHNCYMKEHNKIIEDFNNL